LAKIGGPRYHIDYCFVPDYWIDDSLAVEVGHFQEWVGVGLSDYVPLLLTLPTRQMILDIVGNLLADRRQLKHLIFDDRIVGLLGKLPIHHRLVP
jgi:hypothetical protein